MFWAVTWIEEDQACHCIVRDMTEQDALRRAPSRPSEWTRSGG